MFLVCNPKPSIVQDKGLVKESREILVSIDHVEVIEKDYYEEGYHLVITINGRSFASNLWKKSL